MTVTKASAIPTDQQQRWLQTIHTRYHHPRFIEPDPLQVLGRYPDPADREVVGLIAALLAYGNVKAILGGVEDALARLGDRPGALVRDRSPDQLRALFGDFRYRVTAGPTLAGLLIGAGRVMRECGSLDAALADAARQSRGAKCTDDDAKVLAALDAWAARIESAGGVSLDHLLPRPSRGSACKRLMLYLRWMVRRDAIDPGGWTSLSPAQLIAPIDTHIHRIALSMGWTTRKQVSLNTAMDVTQALRQFDADDPLRFDFSLTRPGIRNEPIPGVKSMETKRLNSPSRGSGR